MLKNEILRQVLYLAARGIPVFPCNGNKAPACPGGFKAATNDAEAVCALWSEHPAPLIGVPTGAASGLDVLDIDPRHAGDKWLAANRHRIPITRIHQTRSGGWHYIFRHHDGLRNSAGKIAPGVDVRATGGYAIWWPSAGLSVLRDADPAPWPDWLLKLAMPPARSFTPPPMPDGGISDYYIRAALRRAAEVVASAPEGCRNNELNKQCWSLLRFAGQDGIDARRILAMLAGAALAAGLTRSEISATLASALRARGMA